jgi:hypothetical protein
MLRRYTWEKAKEKLLHYRRRSPETSPLYQIVYHSRDDLSVQWELRFQHQYGCLRDEVVKTFDEESTCVGDTPTPLSLQLIFNTAKYSQAPPV